MRLLGVQFEIEGDDLNGNFPSHVEKFYERTNPGDVLIFPEDIGLLVAFSGVRANSTAESIEILYSADRERIDAIAKDPGINNFISAIFLSLTDRFVRDFYNLFQSLSIKYGVYTVTCNNMPRFKRSGDRWEPANPRVYNTAFVFDTSGRLLFSQDKVFLTAEEMNLGISSGNLNEVSSFEIEGRQIGIAISLDAFTPQYISRLEDAEIIIQPDANPGKWNSILSNGRWQPEEWMDSAYYITQRMAKAKHVINPMMVGNLMDIRFEGQSSVTKKAEKGDIKMAYIGNQPTTGFHSIIGIEGFDPFDYVEKMRIIERGLKFQEGVIEIEI